MVNPQKKLKILHFVAGGFTGSTSVAMDLVASSNDDLIKSLLVMRKRPATDMQRVNKLINENFPVKIISGKLKFITILELYLICRKFQPDILMAHGYTEHIWGRYAGLLARVPRIVHIEHNSKENYSRWRLFQALWITKYTDKIVACAEGVKVQLCKLGFPESKILVINNGIDLEKFNDLPHTQFCDRKPSVIMPARFGKQKDHATLIHAVHILKKRSVFVQVVFAGQGELRYLKRAQELVNNLGLQSQIVFAGYCSDLPKQLMQHQICVLSTHYEGMPIALAEGMAAGCAVIGTAVSGVQEMIHHDEDGLLVEHKSSANLADAIQSLLLNQGLAERLARKARQRAFNEFSINLMRAKYTNLYYSLVTEILE